MSEEQSEEKSDDPSQRKLKKAREQGDIARSQDFAMVIATIGSAGAIWMMLHWQVNHLSEIAKAALTSEHISIELVLTVIRDAVVLLTLPVLIGGFCASILGNVMANGGFIFALEKIMPKLSMMTLSAYSKRTFSRRGAVELAKITLYTLSLGVIYVQLLRIYAGDFFKVLNCGVSCGFSLFSWLTALGLGCGLFVALATALVDIRLQSILFTEQQRSTKTETKRELKEDMGEPVMRQERRRQHNLFVGPTLIEAVASSSLVLRDAEKAAAAISVFHTGPQRRSYFLVQGGAGPAAVRILEAARETNKVCVDAQGLALKLIRYNANSEIVVPDICKELEFVLNKVDMGLANY